MKSARDVQDNRYSFYNTTGEDNQLNRKSHASASLAFFDDEPFSITKQEKENIKSKSQSDLIPRNKYEII